MFEEKRKEKLIERKEIMIFKYGFEEVIITTNDFDSDDNSYTDISSCSSESGYEEIEVNDRNSPPNGHVEKSLKKLPNPYVKLFRCDHMVSKKAPTICNNIEQLFQSTQQDGYRSPARSRRPNRSYYSDEYALADDKFIDIIKKAKGKKSEGKAKKKVAKCRVKPRLTANKGYSKKKFEKRKTCNDTVCFDYDSKVSPGTNVTIASNEVEQSSPVLHENIKQEIPNDEYRSHECPGSAQHHSGEPSETFEKPWLNTLIKSEPVDEYFEENTAYRFNDNGATVTSGHSLNFVKTEESADMLMFTHNRAVSSEEVHSNERGFMVGSSYNDQVFDDYGRRFVNMEAANTAESSESEIDVVNDWDGPNLTSNINPSTHHVYKSELYRIAFDHPYSKQDNEILTNARKINKVHIMVYPRLTMQRSKRKIMSSAKTSAKTHPLSKVTKRCETKIISTNDKETAAITNDKNTTSTKSEDDKINGHLSGRHNELERKRREEMAMLFRGLFQTMSLIEHKGLVRPSKEVILTQATKYIKKLQREETSLNITSSILEAQNKKLQQKLLLLRREIDCLTD